MALATGGSVRSEQSLFLYTIAFSNCQCDSPKLLIDDRYLVHPVLYYSYQQRKISSPDRNTICLRSTKHCSNTAKTVWHSKNVYSEATIGQKEGIILKENKER